MLTTALLSLALLGPVSPHGNAAEDEASVNWKNKSYSISELPVSTGPTVAGTAKVWSDWVLEHDYQMHLSTDARVLVISRRKNSAIKRQLKLIDKTSKYFDKLLPAPKKIEKEAADKPGPTKPSGDGDLPEDPEGGLVGWNEAEPQKEGQTTWSYEWGASTFERDTETCLVFVAKDMEDYGSILDKLGSLHDYLKPWVPTGKSLTGFVLERPLAAAYIENVSGQEEWNPNNELVNRTAQMLFLRRFSQLPYWLVQGLAWHVEWELLEGLYCFPYRGEFVFAAEHTSWPAELKQRYKSKKPLTIEMSDFSEWRRGKFKPDPARVSFGFVSFLAREHKNELSGFAEGLRVFWEKDNRVDTGGGSWSRKVGYEISSANQQRMLREAFGNDVLEKAAKSLAKGKK